MLPLIITTCSSEKIEGNGLIKLTLYKNYISRINSSGGSAVISPPGDAMRLAAAADGLLLPGGGDVDPALYGEIPLEGAEISVDRQRDDWEIELFSAFFKAKKPIFGICRGLQVINVALGGGLWQDLPLQTGQRHAGTEHSAEAVPGSIVHRFFGGRFGVNSFHHQAVRRPGRGLFVSALGGETVEALEHEERPVFGVQWHPERMDDMHPLFDYFIGLAKGNVI